MKPIYSRRHYWTSRFRAVNQRPIGHRLPASYCLLHLSVRQFFFWFCFGWMSCLPVGCFPSESFGGSITTSTRRYACCVLHWRRQVARGADFFFESKNL